jgi:uncharacterized glyoxalase superfamily protein PhnB
MPDGVLIPVLAYRDVGEAIDWLTGSFGFQERWRVGDHRAQQAVGPNAAIALVQGSAAQGDDHVMVRVENLDEHHAWSLASGAEVTVAPAGYPFGERQYTVRDFSAKTWVFTQSVTDVAPEDWGVPAASPLTRAEPKGLQRARPPALAVCETCRRGNDPSPETELTPRPWGRI